MITNAIQVSIDRQDARYNTRMPFDPLCPLRLPYGNLPEMSIRSLKLQCDEQVVPPVKVDSIELSNGRSDSCDIVFADVNHYEVGRWTVYMQNYMLDQHDYMFNVIRNSNGVIVGHISFQPYVVGLLLGAATSNGNNVYEPDSGDFVVSPLCLIPWFSGHGRAISVNGVASTANMKLSFGDYTRSELSATGALQVSVIGKYKDIEINDGIKYLSVTPANCLVSVNDETPSEDSIWLGGQLLIFRSTIASNIRVASTAGGVQFKGVADG